MMENNHYPKLIAPKPIKAYSLRCLKKSTTIDNSPKINHFLFTEQENHNVFNTSKVKESMFLLNNEIDFQRELTDFSSKNEIMSILNNYCQNKRISSYNNNVSPFTINLTNNQEIIDLNENTIQPPKRSVNPFFKFLEVQSSNEEFGNSEKNKFTLN